MLRKLLRNISQFFQQSSYNREDERDYSPVRKDQHALHHDTFMNIRVFPAVGGKVIQVTNIETQQTNNFVGSTQERTTLYVIPESANFSKELEHIFSMERLK